MTTAQTIKKLQIGFTLIELLIVMAVVAVLAGIVLISINPAEQLARSADTGRINGVGVLGRAMQAQITALALSTAPAAVASWQTDYLVTPGNIKTALTNTYSTATCAIAANNQTNYCYAPNGADFWVWTFLEAKSNADKAAGAATACGAGTNAAYVFDSAQGKSGFACVSTTAAIAAAPTLY